MTDCGRHSEEEKAWLDYETARLRSLCVGTDMLYMCPVCGSRRVAKWEDDPICHGADHAWQMIMLAGAPVSS